jgi:hypothetical protein
MAGNITRLNALPFTVKNSKIYILDIRNFTWISTFGNDTCTPRPTPFSGPCPTCTNTSAVISGTVTAAMGIIGLLFYVCYIRRHIRRHNNIECIICGRR